MINEKLKQLETAPIGRLLWKYSVPAILGSLVISIYNIIDRIFIGQGVGTDAIAGLAVTFPLMNITVAFGVLIGLGATARISIVLGEKNLALAERILGNCLSLTVLVGVTYMILFAIFLKDIIYMFGASDSTFQYAYDYIFYLLPGFVVMNLMYSFNNIMRGSGYPLKAMVTLLIGAVVNVILDPIFIFTLDMGIKGAAIATDISMTISMLFVIWHFMQQSSSLHFKRGTYKIDMRITLSIIAIGASPFLINLAGCLVSAIVNNSMLKYGGDYAVGAIGISNTYVQILVMAIIGICQGMQPIAGYNYGAGHFPRLRHTYMLAMSSASVLCVCGALFALLSPQYIARVFTTDDKLIEVTANGLRILTMMFWIVGFQIVSTNFFQSIGKAKQSIFLSLSRQVIFLIPLIYILPNFYHLDGVWGAFPAADTLASILTLILIINQFKKMPKTDIEEAVKN